MTTAERTLHLEIRVRCSVLSSGVVVPGDKGQVLCPEHKKRCSWSDGEEWWCPSETDWHPTCPAARSEGDTEAVWHPTRPTARSEGDTEAVATPPTPVTPQSIQQKGQAAQRMMATHTECRSLWLQNTLSFVLCPLTIFPLNTLFIQSCIWYNNSSHRMWCLLIGITQSHKQMERFVTSRPPEGGMSPPEGGYVTSREQVPAAH